MFVFAAGYTGTTKNLQFVCFKYLEKSLLACTPNHPKKYLPNFPSKISNPQKILQSSSSLEIWSTPPAMTCGNV